jgi:predicted nucleic acid-binding Zn ribbon protein
MCHNNYHNRKRTKATHPEIKCEVCGAAIIQRNIEQRFCSTKCRMAYWKERQTPSLKSRDLFA